MAIERTKSNTQRPRKDLTKRDFLEEHNHCILCGSKLELKHTVCKQKNETIEEAHCASCSMRVRSTTHILN